MKTHPKTDGTHPKMDGTHPKPLPPHPGGPDPTQKTPTPNPQKSAEKSDGETSEPARKNPGMVGIGRNRSRREDFGGFWRILGDFGWVLGGFGAEQGRPPPVLVANKNFGEFSKPLGFLGGVLPKFGGVGVGFDQNGKFWGGLDRNFGALGVVLANI